MAYKSLGILNNCRLLIHISPGSFTSGSNRLCFIDSYLYKGMDCKMWNILEQKENALELIRRIFILITSHL